MTRGATSPKTRLSIKKISKESEFLVDFRDIARTVFNIVTLPVCLLNRLLIIFNWKSCMHVLLTMGYSF